MARTPSAHTPVALTTTLARTVNSEAGSPSTGRDHGAVGLAVGAHGHADDRGVVGHRGTELERGGAGQGEREPGVVRPGVEVEEAGDEVIGLQRGQVGQGLVLVHLAVALADAPAASEVVEPQGGRVGAGDRLGDHTVLAEERDQEGEG